MSARAAEAAALAAREAWILNTRGADLPRSESVFAPNKGKKRTDEERHEIAMAAQRARREKYARETVDVRAARALEMYRGGAMLSAIAAELTTTHAQVGRLLRRAQRQERKP